MNKGIEISINVEEATNGHLDHLVDVLSSMGISQEDIDVAKKKSLEEHSERPLSDLFTKSSTFKQFL